MAPAKKRTDVKKNEEVSSTNIGQNIGYFRNKKKDKEGKPSQTEFAGIISGLFQNLDYSSLTDEQKKDYDLLKDKVINQQLISEWETGEAETPKLIAYLAAQYFKLDITWLTDYTFEVFENPGFVQMGGSSVNNFHHINTQTINNDAEVLFSGFQQIIQTNNQFILENFEPKRKK